MIKKSEETGSVQGRPRSGRPSLDESTVVAVNFVVEETSSESSAFGTTSVRKVAAEVGTISKTSVHKILRHNLRTIIGCACTWACRQAKTLWIRSMSSEQSGHYQWDSLVWRGVLFAWWYCQYAQLSYLDRCQAVSLHRKTTPFTEVVYVDGFLCEFWIAAILLREHNDCW